MDGTILMTPDAITTAADSADYYGQYSADQIRFFVMFGEVSCKFANLEFITRLVLERLATPRCMTISAILTNDATISDRLKMIRKLSGFRYVDSRHEELRDRFDQFTRDVRGVIEERNQYVHCNWNVSTGAAEDLARNQIYRSNYRDQWKKKAITVLQKNESLPGPPGAECVRFEDITALAIRLQELIERAEGLIASILEEPGMHIDNPDIPFTHQSSANSAPDSYPTRIIYRRK